MFEPLEGSKRVGGGAGFNLSHGHGRGTTSVGGMKVAGFSHRTFLSGGAVVVAVVRKMSSEAVVSEGVIRKPLDFWTTDVGGADALPIRSRRLSWSNSSDRPFSFAALGCWWLGRRSVPDVPPTTKILARVLRIVIKTIDRGLTFWVFWVKKQWRWAVEKVGEN